MLMDDINWGKSKLMLVATEYTNDQKGTIDDKTELWEIKRYKNGTISFNRLDRIFNRVDKAAPEGDSEYMFDIQKEMPSKPKKKKTKQVHKKFTKSFTIGERKHLANTSKKVRSLYKRFKDGVLALGDIEIKLKKTRINFIANARIAVVVIQKNQLKMRINMPEGELKDPRKIMRDTSKVKSWPRADYEKVIKPDMSDEGLKRILQLVKQSFRYHKSKKKAFFGDEDSPSGIVKKTTKKSAKSRTEKDHLTRASKETKKSYNRFKDGVLALGDVSIEPKIKTVNFVTNARIAVVIIQKDQFKMWIRMPKGELYDPENTMRDTSSIENEAGADYEKIITSDMPDEDLKYILGLVKQSLEYKGKKRSIRTR